MKQSFCAVVLGLALALPAGSVYSQEHEMERGPRASEGRPPMPMPMPGGSMGGMRGHRGMGMMMQLMKENPKLAGIMMQMHGEMMRIRGEEMSKMGDVLKRYGERLEKEIGK
jgi:hypothetical protein